jgi:heme-degrading monooxygenase HmoA
MYRTVEMRFDIEVVSETPLTEEQILTAAESEQRGDKQIPGVYVNEAVHRTAYDTLLKEEFAIVPVWPSLRDV